ncbi:MAG: hypothetical protein QGG42_13835 [Phycisphaerae bacterium]|jgi:hypothetical protein|nr:hypothetical protein [Phycisphaerae bacterium]
MKTKTLFTLLMVAAITFVMGCGGRRGGRQKLRGWQSNIDGSYKSEIFSGNTPFRGVTTFSSDGGKLGGTYELDDNGEKVTGLLTKFAITGKNTMKCRWTDKNGEGNFYLTFSEDLSSFKGTWDSDGEGGQSAWNGKR